MNAMFPSLGEAYYLLEWAIRLVMLVIVPLRRPPAAATSWLLLILFLPLPGLALFLAIGRPSFPAWRVARFADLAPFFVVIAEQLRIAAPLPRDSRRRTAELAERLGGLPATGGNAIELIGDYDTVIERLVADIDAARLHVRILAYIFADDATGQRVIAALGRAAARGVACHVLVDPVGGHRWIKGTLRRLAEAGVEARETLPFHWLRGRTRRDMRNHRKLFLIDGAIGYAGSQNIVDKDFRPGVTNRELVARIEGPAVAELTAVFVADWYLETEKLLDPQPAIAPPAGDAELQVLPSGANYPLSGFLTLLVWQVDRAEREVTIVTPYLVPDEGLLAALRTAVLRGVEVRIVVSAVVDQWFVNLAQASYYDELLSAGVRIHRYRDYLLHAKNIRIDGRLGIVGSSNVDIRSFQLNEEVSLLLLDPASVEHLRAVQEGYFAHSDPVIPEQWRRRGRLRRLAENFARLVSPLL
ncbi:MAG: phospholipase D-like domain-containing protein [Candidatus Andeanibacterium colombiense]|uniref:Phospholipase D n=1 Tax=Candidatus Andeanibacterium colombiense TaxID=3121345 RepID=A0AAJ5X3W9_9SPHN|nr:MAG: phospholipase D-like domain-containing protein [Sphingomonadaceae bacterium]